ncbi:MAG: sugar ABC transporter substrate-binding protein [Nannocystales bacterium]
MALPTLGSCGVPGAESEPAAKETRSAAETSVPKKTSARDAPKKVGVLYWSMSIPGQVAMREGLEAAVAQVNASRKADGLGALELVPRIAGDGDEGIERQMKQMDELLDLGVDIIIAQPTDTAALRAGLRRANAMNIPVVAYDQHILGGKMASFVTSDNYQAGYLDGEYVASRFPDEKSLKVIIVEYPQVSSTVERVDGFADALEASGQAFDVIKTYNAVEPVSGKQAGLDILKDFPEPGSVDVVFTVNDGGGLSVFSELEAAGRTEIFGATNDGDPSSVEQIRAQGIIKIDSAQFCGELGATALRTANALLRGEEVSPKLLVPVFPITVETQSLYKGWVGEVPKEFRKPWESATPMWSPEIRRGGPQDP